MAIVQSPKNIFQRQNFPGKSLKFRRKSDVCQISGSEIWKFGARKNAIPYPQPFHTPTRLPSIKHRNTRSHWKFFPHENKNKSLWVAGLSDRSSRDNLQHHFFVMISRRPWPSNPSFFWRKKAKETPKNARVFLFAEPLKSLEKKGKTQRKAREIGKRNNNTKKEILRSFCRESETQKWPKSDLLNPKSHFGGQNITFWSLLSLCAAGGSSFFLSFFFNDINAFLLMGMKLISVYTGIKTCGHKKLCNIKESSEDFPRILRAVPLLCQTPPSYGFGRYGFGFFGPRIAFRATGALWGRATPFFYHFSVHLSSVLGRTELCHEVWTPGPQKPQIINNENHHLALLDCGHKMMCLEPSGNSRQKVDPNFGKHFARSIFGSTCLATIGGQSGDIEGDKLNLNAYLWILSTFSGSFSPKQTICWRPLRSSQETKQSAETHGRTADGGVFAKVCHLNLWNLSAAIEALVAQILGKLPSRF